MPPGDKEKLNRVEELKNKLFSTGFKPKVGHRDSFLHPDNTNVPDNWTHVEKKVEDLGQKFFMKTSIFKNFFVFSLVFLGLAFLYGGYEFFIGGNTVSNSNIDISIL